MSSMESSINLEHEKKKNIRIALGVASIGVLGFFIIYIVFFAIMFFLPWTLFGFFPFPSFSEEVAGINGDLIIFSKGINFKGVTYKKPPEEKMALRIYNGQFLSEPEEIKPFESLYATENKIYFFDKGLYRTFNLREWKEFKNSAIGSSPKGAVGTEGIWVLSKIKSKPVIFQQGIFSENYYVINGEQITGPFRISKPFFLSSALWEILFTTVSSTAIFYILVFLLSILIRKFKLKTWRIDSMEYEFASLFRRFLAKTIDSILLIIPVSIPLYFALKEDIYFDNPFILFALTIFSSVLIILGSFFYYSILEGLWGKTIGKMMCGIIVLKDDFTKCNIWRGFLRNFFRIIDNFIYYLVAVVTMAGTMKLQRLGV